MFCILVMRTLLGILITGCKGCDDYEIEDKSAEFLRENGTEWISCNLPLMSIERSQHTQSGLTACGGGFHTRSTCETFSSGQWRPANNLRQMRVQHMSWRSPIGYILMGGFDYMTTTELLSEEDDLPNEEQFPLKYQTV